MLDLPDSRSAGKDSLLWNTWPRGTRTHTHSHTSSLSSLLQPPSHTFTYSHMRTNVPLHCTITRTHMHGNANTPSCVLCLLSHSSNQRWLPDLNKGVCVQVSGTGSSVDNSSLSAAMNTDYSHLLRVVWVNVIRGVIEVGLEGLKPQLYLSS